MLATIKRTQRTAVKLKTITGRQLAEWRVHGLELTQVDLALWLGRTRRFVQAAEKRDDAEIPRSTYLACLGLATEISEARKRQPKG